MSISETLSPIDLVERDAPDQESVGVVWTPTVPFASLQPDRGVAVLVHGVQVALFRLSDGDRVYALSNKDPFSGANVISRGIVGDRWGVTKVASPIYKQSFALTTGVCLDDASVRLRTYEVRVVGGIVEIATDVE